MKSVGIKRGALGVGFWRVDSSAGMRTFKYKLPMEGRTGDIRAHLIRGAYIDMPSICYTRPNPSHLNRSLPDLRGSLPEGGTP